MAHSPATNPPEVTDASPQPSVPPAIPMTQALIAAAAARPSETVDASKSAVLHGEGQSTPGAFNLRRIDLLLLLMVTVWGAHFSIAKAAVDIIPPLLYNALRFSLGAVVIGLIARSSGARLGITWREARLVGWSAFLNSVVYQVFWLNGLRNTNVANSVLISTFAPALVVLWNIYAGRERGSRGIFFGIGTALSGIFIVILSRYAGQIAFGGTTLLGDALSVGAAFVWAVSIFVQKRMMDSETPALVLHFWSIAIAAGITWLIATPDILNFDWSLFATTPALYLALAYSGIIAVGIGSTVFAFAVKRVGPSRPAMFINLQPIVAAAVAVLFLGEAFTVWLVVGTGMVLYGMYRVRKG